MKKLDVYKESVKKLLAAAESDLELSKHLCGTIVDVITVEKRYRIAIGAAVGSSVQNVITPTMESARRLIEHMKMNGGGATTFIPLDTIVPKFESEEVKQALEEDGALGLATKLVQYDPYYEKAVFYFLGNTLVCDTIANATAIVKKCPTRFKIVTLDGDIIYINGMCTGGESQKQFGRYFDDESEK